MRHENALAIVVIDSKVRYVNERINRGHDETPEAFADRIRARVVELLTCPGKS